VTAPVAVRATIQDTAAAYVAAVKTACDSRALAEPMAAYQQALEATAGQPVARADAVELLATHAITRPLYAALFAGPYPFTAQTGTTAAIAPMLAALDTVVDVDLEPLAGLHEQAADQAAAITDHATRQPLITGLYEHFFRTALPRIADRHGIVYTPTEVVDFQLRSTDQALRRSHGCGLADERVQIIDPFAGTGIYAVRLLQGDLIPDAALTRVYRHQLHAHEIVPLAWHIARTNITVAYAERTGRYLPYLGLYLGDTFTDTCPRCRAP
jgi:predicted helicase